MTIRLLLIVFFTTILLSGCEKKSKHKAKVKRGLLVTPNGSYKVRPWNENFSTKGHSEAYFVFVDTGDLSIRFNLHPNRGTFFIRHNPDYQQSFSVTEISYSIEGQSYSYSYNTEPKYQGISRFTTMEKMSFSAVPNGPLSDREFVFLNKNSIYKVRMEFTLDNKPYTFYVDYKFWLHYWHELGIPGTGP